MKQNDAGVALSVDNMRFGLDTEVIQLLAHNLCTTDPRRVPKRDIALNRT